MTAKQVKMGPHADPLVPPLSALVFKPADLGGWFDEVTGLVTIPFTPCPLSDDLRNALDVIEREGSPRIADQTLEAINKQSMIDTVFEVSRIQTTEPRY